MRCLFKNVFRSADEKAKLRYEDIEYLNNLFKYNPVLKLREAEILRWYFRGLTLEESIIRAQIFTINYSENR